MLAVVHLLLFAFTWKAFKIKYFSKVFPLELKINSKLFFRFNYFLAVNPRHLVLFIETTLLLYCIPS